MIAFLGYFCYVVKSLNHYRITNSIGRTTTLNAIESAPYDDIIPFLSEHIQPSDQLLFVGAKSDLAIQLSKNGYGSKKTGFLVVVDPDQNRLDECKAIAKSIPEVAEHLNNNKLSFVKADYHSMSSVCKQSSFDAIVDFGGIDSILSVGSSSEEIALQCIDHLQNAVRLGNILVCLSKLDKEVFCSPFEKRFGWVQELDGDPGEISAWYRGKTNIQATKSKFKELGLKMFVYTNVDNC